MGLVIFVCCRALTGIFYPSLNTIMKQIFPFLLLLASFTASSQTDVTKVFEIPANHYDLGTVVLPDGAGYAVFGYGGVPSSSNIDMFLLRLDQDGNEISRHFYGLPNRTERLARGVVAVGNEGWLMAGGAGLVVRVGATGNVLWSKNLSGVANLSTYCLKAIPSGGYIAAGEYLNDAKAVRLTENGDMIWQKTYPGYRVEAMIVSESGAYSFMVTRNEVLKVRNSDGQLIWSKPLKLSAFGNPLGSLSVNLHEIVSVGNGKFAVCGTALNDAIFDFEEAPYASVWKENGEILWAEAYPAGPGAGGTTCNSILYTPNQQNLLLTGEGNVGVHVTRIDMNGTKLAAYAIPTPALCVSPVLLRHQGKYIATGGCFTSGMNTLFYRSGGNWLPGGNLKPEDRDDTSAPGISLYPNPGTDRITLDYWSDLDLNLEIQVFNAVGALVMTAPKQAFYGFNSATLDVQSLPSGAYWILAPEIGLPATAWVKQ